jgi:hypothetical protein
VPATNRQLDLAREQGAAAEREKHTIEPGEHNRQLAELRERLAAKDAEIAALKTSTTAPLALEPTAKEAVSPAPEPTGAEAPAAKTAKKKT